MSKGNELDRPIAGPAITEYCPPRNLRRLAAATITQAVKDLHNRRDVLRSVGALCWLTDSGSDFQTFCDVVDVANLDIFELLSAGGAARMLRKL